MKIISIGKWIQNLDYPMNIQNYKTWSGMSQYFEDVYVVVESTDKSDHFEHYGNMHIIWIGKRNHFDNIHFILHSYKVCKKIIKEENIDVIDAGEPINGGISAVMLKYALKRKMTLQIQGQLLNLPKDTFSAFRRWSVKTITKIVAKKADRVRAVTNEIKCEIAACGIPEDKIEVALPRCDTSIFDPSLYVAERNKNREIAGFEKSDFLVAFTGSLIKTKDPETLVRAIYRVVQKGIPCKAVIMGDGPLKKRLEDLAEKYGIFDNIRLTGKVPYDQIPMYLSISDAYVLPSTNEAFARGVLEAMAMTLPVIATKVGGNSETIIDGENGYLIEVGDDSAIADFLIHSYENPESGRRMGENARKRVIERHEYHKCIADFANIFLK